MKFTVQLVIEPGDGSKVVTEATLGLTLAESKTILARLQESMVAQQAASYSTAHQTCLWRTASVQGPSPDRRALAVRHAPAR